MSSKRILFITDTYYPDSGATSTIVKRTAEALAERGYVVDVYPSEISGQHFDYDKEYNGVRIVRELDATGYDAVFSCAVNFEVNFLAHEAIIKTPSLRGRVGVSPWFPMSYDPYAYDPHITEEERQLRITRENDALKDATRIFFLTEFKQDYVGSPIEDKIEWFMLPCVRPINPDRTKKVVEFDDSYINCVFLGDFYWGIENTDFIFRLFEKLPTNIRLYTIGNLGDYHETVDMWKRKLGNRYICHERISQEEAHNVMLDCDVLVSMGHDSPNMCPSKCIDFMCSGKPILHIQKIENCCAKRYMEPYPNKYSIYQGEELTDAKIAELEQFMLNAKDCDRVPFEWVQTQYSDFTLETLITKIIREIKKH